MAKRCGFSASVPYGRRRRVRRPRGHRPWVRPRSSSRRRGPDDRAGLSQTRHLLLFLRLGQPVRGVELRGVPRGPDAHRKRPRFRRVICPEPPFRAGHGPTCSTKPARRVCVALCSGTPERGPLRSQPRPPLRWRRDSTLPIGRTSSMAEPDVEVPPVPPAQLEPATGMFSPSARRTCSSTSGRSSSSSPHSSS